jgi:hypothetical protein
LRGSGRLLVGGNLGARRHLLGSAAHAFDQTVYGTNSSSPNTARDSRPPV